ncbi:MAG: tyrosine-type recombinase/integrase [Aquirhabdus sp.]
MAERKFPPKSKSPEATKAERARNRYITSRYQGRSFWVRMRLHGIPVQATFDTIEDARAYRDRMLADAATDPTHRLIIESRQTKIKADKDTLGSLLMRYSSEVSVTKKSVKSERNRIEIILGYEIAQLPISLVNREAMLRFLVHIRERNISESTVRKYLMLLSAFFTTAKKKWGMSVHNPIKDIVVPSNGRGRDRRVEAGEYERIVAEIKSSHPISQMMLFSIETACRRGELLSLLWENVDLEKRIAVLKNTKINSETRVIPLSRIAVNILSALPRKEFGKVFNISEHSINSAWSSARRRALKKYIAQCAAENVAPKANYIDGLRWHDMRHEGTSRLFEHGLDLMEVASVTGHKTLSMLRNYTHLKAQNLAQKIDRAADSDSELFERGENES